MVDRIRDTNMVVWLPKSLVIGLVCDSHERRIYHLGDMKGDLVRGWGWEGSHLIQLQGQ